MSKVILKVEIDEEAYKQIKGDSVCSNNNECIISKSSSAYYALNAIINATPLTKSDDAVSRQAFKFDEWDIGDKKAELWVVKGRLQIRYRGTIHNVDFPVLPKREQGGWKNMTNQEKLSTLTAEEFYDKIIWLFHDYGKRYTNSRLSITEWLQAKSEEKA